MKRSTWRAGFITALVLVVAVLAASSGKVNLWVIDASSADLSVPASDPPEPAEVRPTPSTDDGPEISLPEWTGPSLALAVGLALVAAAVVAAASGSGSLRRVRWPQLRLHRATPETVEALADDDVLVVDIDALHLALTGGDPADAIIAAWMQLESDTAVAGFPRLAHETSAEYAERVVARASVDATPIGELAALYREARFSQHPLGDSHRERARDALHRVEATLHRTRTEA